MSTAKKLKMNLALGKVGEWFGDDAQNDTRKNVIYIAKVYFSQTLYSQAITLIIRGVTKFNVNMTKKYQTF